MPQSAISSHCTPSLSLHSFPPSIIDITLQLPRDHGWYTLRQPHVPEQSIIAFLTEGQLAAATETEVGFTEPIEVRGQVEGAVAVVQVDDATFTYVEEDADVDATSVMYLFQ